jgi:60 kDa SS-A/Ro ribonucleoprotein
MALNYAKLFNRRATPQSQPIPGSTQVANSAGGYSWQADDWTRFERFLILGAEGGTYYVTEQDLVKQNHDAIVRCIKVDGVRAVNRIVEISQAGRALNNAPAIFALALVAAHGSHEAKALAFQNLAKVCRIGTHLFLSERRCMPKAAVRKAASPGTRCRRSSMPWMRRFTPPSRTLNRAASRCFWPWTSAARWTAR